MPERQV